MKRMLSLILALVMMSSLTTISVSASEIVDSGMCGDKLSWTLDSEGLLTISGVGEMYSYHDNASPWRNRWKNINTVIIEEGAISIGNHAFDGCERLTDITIPDSVNSIGDSAFEFCDSLASITIPDSVTSIGDSTFCECSSLTSVTIPDSVTSIGDSAFAFCRSLASVIIPDGVTSIGDCVFAYCDGLISITIPNGVTSIGVRAFDSCESLTAINIPDGVTSIGDYAFEHCHGLTSLTIPDSVTSIGGAAFYDCQNITDITISGSAMSIKWEAFMGCDSLTNLAILDGVISIGTRAFYGCDSLASVTIPNSVTSIGQSVFSMCNSLTSVIISDSVTSIGSGAFYECDSLSNIYYGGSKSQWKATGAVGNAVAYDVTIHYNSTGPNDDDSGDSTDSNDDETEINLGSVRYFHTWDAENQIAYFDTDPAEDFLNFGSQVTAATDTSFLANVEELVGQYVLVKTKARDDGMIAADILISISPLEETKKGTITSIDGNTVGIDGVKYTVSDEMILWAFSVGDVVLYHRYKGEIVSISKCESNDPEPKPEPDKPDDPKPEYRFAVQKDPDVQQIEIGEIVTVTCILYCNDELVTDWEQPNISITHNETTAPITHGGWTKMADGSYVLKVESTALGTANLVIYESQSNSTETIIVKVGDVSDALRIKAIEPDGITINGHGYANMHFQLTDHKGMPIADRVMVYTLEKKEYTTTTDENGIVNVTTPELYSSKQYNVKFSLPEYEGRLIGAKQDFTVEVQKLSYSQSWEVALGVDLSASAGAGAGVGLGVASAEASAAKAIAKAGINGELSLKDSYKNGERTMELEYTNDASKGIKFKSGVEATVPTTNINIVSASAGGDLVKQNSIGLKIENYDPSSIKHLYEVGAFCLQSAAIRSNSVLSTKIIDYLDIGSHNQSSYTVKAVLDVGGNIGVIEAGGEKYGITSADTKLVVSSSWSTDYLEGTKKQNAQFLADTGFGILDGLPTVSGNLFGKNINNAMELTAAYDSGNLLDKLSYKFYSSDKSNIIWGGFSDDYSTEISFHGDEAVRIADDAPILEKYLNAQRSLLAPAELISSALTIAKGNYHADYTDNHTIKQGANISLPFKLELGLGLELGIDGSYVEKLSYDTGGGVWTENKMYESSVSTVSKTEAEAQRRELTDILRSAFDTISNSVAKFFSSVGNFVTDGVKSTYSSLTGTEQSWYAEVSSIVSDKNSYAQAYAVLALSDGDAEDCTSAVAVTLGEPHFIAVYTDSNKTAVVSDDEFAAAPLTLTLSYTEQMLTAAGVSDDASINIYLFDENRNAYILVEQCVQDKADMTVSAKITKNGEYILATDNASPLISGFTLSDFTATPQLDVFVSDLSGIGEFSFWVDDEGVLVDSETFESYYDAATNNFSYKFDSPLSAGEHTAYFQAADALGNSNEEPFAFTFIIDNQAPVIEKISVPDGYVAPTDSFSVSAAVSDDTEISQVMLDVYGDDGKYTSSIMNERNGLWQVDVPAIGGRSSQTLKFVAVDWAGNRTESSGFVLENGKFKKPHDSHNYDAVVTTPTCTEQGYTTYSCECGESYVDNYVAATGHKWDDGKVTKEPTASEEGEKIFTCTVCGETKTEKIDKVEEIPPVCSHVFKNKYCVHCGAREPYEEKVDINYRKIKIVLDGEEITPCDGLGNTVEPFIMSSTGTTYLPLRAVSQALGLNVHWDEPTNTVNLSSGGTVKTGLGPSSDRAGQIRTKITYRNIRVILDGKLLTLVNSLGVAVDPFILNSNSSVYLPLRIIGEALGLTVNWDGDTSTVYLVSKQG